MNAYGVVWTPKNVLKGGIQSKKNKKNDENSAFGVFDRPPQMQKNTTYFSKASGIILSNFGKN